MWSCTANLGAYHRREAQLCGRCIDDPMQSAVLSPRRESYLYCMTSSRTFHEPAMKYKIWCDARKACFKILPSITKKIINNCPLASLLQIINCNRLLRFWTVSQSPDVKKFVSFLGTMADQRMISIFSVHLEFFCNFYTAHSPALPKHDLMSLFNPYSVP